MGGASCTALSCFNIFQIAMTKTIAICLLICFALGCGERRPKTYPVTGMVTLDGKPIENASVSFVPQKPGEDTDAATGLTDASGTYQLTTFVANDGARDGQYAIRITKYLTKEGELPEHNDKSGDPPERFEGYGPGYNPLKPGPIPKNVLPTKYENQVTSGFTHTVPKSPSTVNLALKGK
jgi:hypothetical protein